METEKESIKNSKRIAVKVGSNVLTQEDGTLNFARIAHLVEQIGYLHKKGNQVILISSGAVAAGRGEFDFDNENTPAAERVWSSIGQVKLMSTYTQLFANLDISCAQVLTTKENFGSSEHYKNMKDSIDGMLDNQVVPIVNENDTISVSTTMFTDNDELSGLIASMMSCDMLFLLSNVDGLYTGKPGTEGAELIPEISGSYEEVKKYISSEKSGLGRGGMESKCNTAIKIANQGVTVYIANGNHYDIITDILEGKTKSFTKFTGTKTRTNDMKTWLSHAETFARGEVYVDNETAEALMHKKNFSLYTHNITRVEGIFEPDDVIRILNEKGEQLGVGKVQMPSQEVLEMKGSISDKPIIHHDYFVVDDIKFEEPKA